MEQIQQKPKINQQLNPCLALLDKIQDEKCCDKLHNQQPYILICLDTQCNHKGEPVCSECILEKHNHNSQSFVSISKFRQFQQQEFKKNNKKHNHKNDVQQQNPKYETIFKQLMQQFQIFKNNMVQQLEQVEKRIQLQIEKFTVHKYFEPTFEDLETEKLENLVKKMKYYARTFLINEEKQIDENLDIDEYTEKLMTNQKPKIEIINKKFLQIMQQQINLSKFAKFDDINTNLIENNDKNNNNQNYEVKNFSEKQICRFMNYVDGDWGINQNTFVRIGLQSKNKSENFQLLGLKQNKIQKWKGKDQVDFRIVIFKGIDFGQNLIFDETFRIEQAKETVDESGEFYDLRFSNPVQIDGDEQYIIVQMHPHTCFTFCGGGRKQENMIEDLSFFQVNKVSSFEDFEPQPMHDLFEFGLLHYFIYKRIQ